MVSLWKHYLNLNVVIFLDIYNLPRWFDAFITISIRCLLKINSFLETRHYLFPIIFLNSLRRRLDIKVVSCKAPHLNTWQAEVKIPISLNLVFDFNTVDLYVIVVYMIYQWLIIRADETRGTLPCSPPLCYVVVMVCHYFTAKVCYISDQNLNHSATTKYTEI